MTLTQAHQLALSLMEEHGLRKAGWRFRWGSGKRQLGSAGVTRRRDPVTGRTIEVRTITLSRYLVRLNSDEEVRETILHEIAHAIAGVEHGHDAVWQRVCRRIGAKPQRLAGETVKVVAAPLEVVCGACERVLAQRHRRMRADVLERSYCRHCGPKTTGKLTVRAAG
jgi:predicted SprT family Zn-dependent metalloprotease